MGFGDGTVRLIRPTIGFSKLSGFDGLEGMIGRRRRLSVF
jgi:hypothetical protein